MIAEKSLWRCPRCTYVWESVSTRLSERLGTVIGGAAGAFIGYCAIGGTPIPAPGKYRGLISDLMFEASTGNQIGHILDTYLIRVCRCSR